MSAFDGLNIDRSFVRTLEGWAERSNVSIEVYYQMLASGLLADLGGNSLKTLLTMKLMSTILTIGEFFEMLKIRGLVTADDLGQQVCYQSQETLAKLCGIGRDTIQHKIQNLSEHDLITRRMPKRNPNGHFGRPLFIIHDAGLISGPHRCGGCRSPVEFSDAADPTKVSNNLVAVDDLKLDHQQQQPSKPSVETANTAAETVFMAVSAALEHEYIPSQRDRKHLRQLLHAGYQVDEVVAAVSNCIDRARKNNKDPRSFGYCVPAIRDNPPRSSTTLPQPVLNGLQELGWRGSTAEVREFYHRDSDRVQALLTYWRTNRDPEIRNRAAMFREDMRAGNWPPEEGQEDGRRYIEGRYADFIQH